MNEPAIRLAHVFKNFGQIRALNDVSLSIPSGEIWGLLGHNGAGKTTLMKHLLGLLTPTSGSVEVLGHPPVGPAARRLRRSIGYLPETVAFYPELTGRETLTYLARLKGVDSSQCRQLLSDVDLAEAADRRVKTYSNGMRKRLGLAQALLGRPRLLLLDEPTAGLDPIATRKFFRKVEKLASEGVTVLLSSHVLPGIEQHVERVAILGSGTLLASGTLEYLRTSSDLPIVVRVNTSGIEPLTLPEGSLSALPVRQINGHEFEVRSPQQFKLELLRTLMAREDLVDLSVTPPTLDAIYANYYAGVRATREAGAVGNQK